MLGSFWWLLKQQAKSEFREMQFGNLAPKVVKWPHCGFKHTDYLTALFPQPCKSVLCLTEPLSYVLTRSKEESVLCALNTLTRVLAVQFLCSFQMQESIESSDAIMWQQNLLLKLKLGWFLLMADVIFSMLVAIPKSYVNAYRSCPYVKVQILELLVIKTEAKKSLPKQLQNLIHILWFV